MTLAVVLLAIACFCAGWLVHRLAMAGVIKVIVHVLALSLDDPSRMTHTFLYLRNLLKASAIAFESVPRCATCNQPRITELLDAPAVPPHNCA